MESREVRFRRIYDTGRDRVVAYAMRRTVTHEDVADIVAETFAIAWRRLDDVPTDSERCRGSTPSPAG